MTIYSALVSWLILLGTTTPKVEPPFTTAADLFQGMKEHQSVVIIDVRTSQEYQAGHIPGAISQPSASDKKHDNVLGDIKSASGRAVVVYCACPYDTASRMIVTAAVAKGYSRVTYLRGGVSAWLIVGGGLDKSWRSASKATQSTESIRTRPSQ